MEKLELDKEKVIKAYNEGCSDVKKVLENMFGKEIFKEDKYFDLRALGRYEDYKIFTKEDSVKAGFYSSGFLQIRSSGIYGGKSFYLDDDYNWEIIKDNTNLLVLVPTRKQIINQLSKQ